MWPLPPPAVSGSRKRGTGAKVILMLLFHIGVLHWALCALSVKRRGKTKKITPSSKHKNFPGPTTPTPQDPSAAPQYNHSPGISTTFVEIKRQIYL